MEVINVHIKVKVELSLWSAVKLRIAGIKSYFDLEALSKEEVK